MWLGLLSLWTWFLLLAIATLGFVVLLPLAILSWASPQRLLAGLWFRRTARLIAQLSPLWRFEAVTPYPARLAGPHVVVSNHESHLDAFLITHLPYEMKWLAKRSLFFVPIIGWSMALAGDVAIRRGRGRSIGQALRRCRRYLDAGMSVFLFPEGTRGTGEAMLPFKDGAFRLALQARVPVLPLAVAGTAQGLRKDSLRFYPGHAAVGVGTALDTRALAARVEDASDALTEPEAVGMLRDAARAQILELRGQLRGRLARAAGREA